MGCTTSSPLKCARKTGGVGVLCETYICLGNLRKQPEALMVIKAGSLVHAIGSRDEFAESRCTSDVQYERIGVQGRVCQRLRVPNGS